ncbi:MULTISPECIES: response regulator transcription factor [unclassified Amycolatopsis]|uniref:response regulator transcription factor n=1 Tax=unclassified Amycolatopsis TaxID=2618356 RepID=UPI002875F6F7|nr:MULTISPECIES: response regulator transcription factor [unclassified Amycolatopsis]MDS0135813.1 response regulator transcription factor [Amycolatopsis sp. 505]MDS0145586.1 response regulator transcription factor [Amycolatopsis sp. CM201R]
MPATAGNLGRDLRGHGFEVSVVDSGSALLATSVLPDLVLLALDLPDLDGLEVCRRLRARSRVPIVGVSGRDSELDRVLGLQAGLDDYVTGPVRPSEVVAVIDAVLRRVRGAAVEPAAAAETVVHGSLHIGLRAREVRVGGRRVAVTPKEFDLLALLASEPGRVFTRHRIMAEVWRDSSGRGTRTIDTHVRTLRSKLGAHSWVVNVPGIGFRLGG